MRLLLVEDDTMIGEAVLDLLRAEQYAVDWARDGDAADTALRTQAYDLVLLDLGLPQRDGLAVLRDLRARKNRTPVLVATARDAVAQRIEGLDAGADDYVLKPFSVKELVARVEAVLRRSAERPSDVATVNVRGGTADLDRSELRYEDGARVELSEREVTLLRYLAMNAGRVISRDELLERVWRIPPSGVRTRTVDVHVARLRDKLRDDDPAQPLIQTVRGKGYVYTGEAAG